MCTTTVYLDTQQWWYLVDPPAKMGLGLPPAAFESAIQRGDFRVAASLDLILEIIGGFHRDSQLTTQLLASVLRLAGRRILQPLLRRHPLEVIHGGLLPERRRYLPAAMAHDLAAVLSDVSEISAVAVENQQAKRDFKTEQEQLRARIRTELKAAGVMPTRDSVVGWFDTHDRHEWTQSIINGGRDRGLYEVPDDGPWTYQKIPSAFTFLCYQQARVVQTLGEGRTIKESDLADAHHASLGPYVDVPVTDDAVFGLALNLIPGCRFRWMTSAEFAAAYLSP